MQRKNRSNVSTQEIGDQLARLCKADPIFRKWVQPKFLDPRPLREAAMAQSILRWTAIDHFFLEKSLEKMIRMHRRLRFEDDDVGLNYHSTAVRVDIDPEVTGLDLLRYPLWHRYVAYIVGTELHAPGSTVIKYRRHPKWSRGFWIHTDRDRVRPKSAAVLGYFNRKWQITDGGLLQLWDVRPVTLAVGNKVRRWRAYRGKRLSFLENEVITHIEAAGVDCLEVVEARLIDQIVPEYNRLVFIDFQSSPAFHSVTPSYGRARNGFLQWIY